MRVACTIMAAALALSLAGVAHAGTLYTPWLLPGASNWLACSAVNLRRRPREVRIEIFDQDGTSGAQTNVTLLPGKTAFLPTADDNARYCKFTFKGSKKSIRASVCVLTGSNCIAALPAY